MKTLGEAAIDLPWIAPSVASLTALARSPLPSSWPHLRTDPGFLTLYARTLEITPQITVMPAECNAPLLESVLNHLPYLDAGFVDWSQPGPDAVYRCAYRQALLASRLAERINVDAQNAWIAGFLAPLGWLAVTAADPVRVRQHLADLRQPGDAGGWQQQAWGHDHTAMARRLAPRWRLPVWLTAILGHLGLHVNIAERLGAQPTLFQLIQLTVLLLQQRERGLGLPVGGAQADLLAALHLSAEEAETTAHAVIKTEVPVPACESPAHNPLLADFIRLALENGRRTDAAWIERLQQDLDRMQDALVRQCAEDHKRLETMKLSAIAELAAGAGHEINNPLAVISGQAQYVLKQLDYLDGPAEEIDNVGEYLDNLRSKVVPSLQKIVGQTQRIHTILTDLMQFARPSAARLQPVPVRKLMRDVAELLQTEANERKVQLVCTEPANDPWVEADPAQARVALAGLLRNAIQAAPAEGRAELRVETVNNGSLDLIVEDNGAGPPANARDHLFDPFFSGRSAGRGRGMGLPTAWRLARQQGGDVRFEGCADGVTRFILTLATTKPPSRHLNGNGHHDEGHGRNGMHSSLETQR